MATKVTRVDDIDGITEFDGEATFVMVTSAHEDFTFEIDLADANYAKLMSALKKYRDAGRNVEPRKSTATGNGHSAEIRDWAKQNGYDVSDRGKLPANVVEAHRFAMGAESATAYINSTTE